MRGRKLDGKLVTVTVECEGLEIATKVTYELRDARLMIEGLPLDTREISGVLRAATTEPTATFCLEGKIKRLVTLEQSASRTSENSR